MKTNNNSQQIRPYKFKATVEVIGEPNHPYNHVIWIDSVTRTNPQSQPDYYTLENDYDDNV
tara:strand:- start:1299 stop:1481 length:183 start_codon:yes stop_codon:yes gene_type:complete